VKFGDLGRGEPGLGQDLVGVLAERRRRRGSSAMSPRPVASANRRHRPSLPTATISGASAVGSTWYGVRLSCALPCRPGVTPVAKYLPAT
jgi:hypothetical protein